MRVCFEVEGIVNAFVAVLTKTANSVTMMEIKRILKKVLCFEFKLSTVI